jgi:hypothetical protein
MATPNGMTMTTDAHKNNDVGQPAVLCVSESLLFGDEEQDFSIAEDCVFSELDPDGRLWLYLHFCMDSGIDEVMWDAIDAWQNDEDGNPVLRVFFRLSDVLERELEGHELFGSGGLVSQKCKPTLDAMRTELLQMVARIDGVKYADI